MTCQTFYTLVVTEPLLCWILHCVSPSWHTSCIGRVALVLGHSQQGAMCGNERGVHLRLLMFNAWYSRIGMCCLLANPMWSPPSCLWCAGKYHDTCGCMCRIRMLRLCEKATIMKYRAPGCSLLGHRGEEEEILFFGPALHDIDGEVGEKWREQVIEEGRRSACELDIRARRLEWRRATSHMLQNLILRVPTTVLPFIQQGRILGLPTGDNWITGRVYSQCLHAELIAPLAL